MEESFRVLTGAPTVTINQWDLDSAKLFSKIQADLKKKYVITCSLNEKGQN